MLYVYVPLCTLILVQRLETSIRLFWQIYFVYFFPFTRMLTLFVLEKTKPWNLMAIAIHKIVRTYCRLVDRQ